MFGLGWTELLLIGGVIMLIAGPAAAPKLLASFESVRRARGLDKISKMNAALDSLSEEDDSEKGEGPGGGDR